MSLLEQRKELEGAGVTFTQSRNPNNGRIRHHATFRGEVIATEPTIAALIVEVYNQLGG